jgi:regulatory protein
MRTGQSKEIPTPGRLLDALRRWCAYQERSHKQVREHLREIGSEPEWVDGIIERLMEEGMLNEERFARAYVRGKHRQSRWGRRKIIQGLASHGININLSRMALTEIDPDEYYSTIQLIANRQWPKVKGRNALERKWKMMRWLSGRGFENDLINEVLTELLKSADG